jgi:hypothetical protein
MQATIASQFAPVATRANATARAQRVGVPSVCRIRAAVPAKRAVAPVAGASFAGDRALNVAFARQVTLKSQRTRGVVRCDAQAAAEGDR